jgi:hypothetical protein
MGRHARLAEEEEEEEEEEREEDEEDAFVANTTTYSQDSPTQALQDTRHKTQRRRSSTFSYLMPRRSDITQSIRRNMLDVSCTPRTKPTFYG